MSSHDEHGGQHPQLPRTRQRLMRMDSAMSRVQAAPPTRTPAPAGATMRCLHAAIACIAGAAQSLDVGVTGLATRDSIFRYVRGLSFF